MHKFFVVTAFIALIAVTLFTLLLVSGKNDVGTNVDTHTKIMSGPASKVYAVPEASTVSWPTSPDANPELIHDMSLHSEK